MWCEVNVTVKFFMVKPTNLASNSKLGTNAHS